MPRGKSEVRDARRAVQNRPVVLDSLLPPQASSRGGMGSLATDSRPTRAIIATRPRILRRAAAGFERMGASAPDNIGASNLVSGWSPTIWGLDLH